MPPMLYVLIFLAAFLAVEGVALLLQERRSGNRATARKRLQKMAMGIQSPEVEDEDSILRGGGESRLSMLGRLPWTTRLERRLYQAGMTIAPGRFVFLCILLSFGMWVLLTLLTASPTVALPGLAAGLIPLVRIRQLRMRRTAKFEEQFPEALELMTRAMRSGHSLTFAFQMVGDELADPIGSEFAQVAEEVKLGQELRIALENLTYRTEAGDLPFFITAISIQRETGGNLAEVLEKLGYLIRERFSLYGKVRALTSIGRASANLLASMPFVMVAMLVTCGGEGGRAYVQPLFGTTAGLIMASIAFALVVMGFVISRRMAQIEV
ncbi:MAG: type II secretion system F family protein [Myxococcota bacterium]